MGNRKLLKSNNGITLIEVMIAMALLGFGMLTVVSLQTGNMLHNSRSKRQTEAYTWISDNIERFLIEEYSSTKLSAGTHTLTDPNHVAQIAPYTMEWTVVDEPLDSDSKKLENAKHVTVVVKWNNREVATVDFMKTEVSF